MLKDTQWVSLEIEQRRAVDVAIDRFFDLASEWDRMPVKGRVARIGDARLELIQRIDDLVETARRIV